MSNKLGAKIPGQTKARVVVVTVNSQVGCSLVAALPFSCYHCSDCAVVGAEDMVVDQRAAVALTGNGRFYSMTG